MKCLILGAGGYLGRHLAATLRENGHDVVAYGSLRSSLENRLDVSDFESLSQLDWNVDAVFLLAGVTGTSASFANFATFINVNDIGVLNVLESLRQSGSRPRVVFPSTRLVYAGSDRPITETSALEAKTIYAASKMSCELYLKAYANAFQIPFTILRIGVPYGNTHGEQYSFGTVGAFIKQAVDAGGIRLYGDGHLRRTFTHIDDVCRAIVMSSTHAEFENEVVNVPGEDLSLLEAAELIAAQLNATITFTPWPTFDHSVESGSTVFDGRKFLQRIPNVITRRMDEWATSLKLPNAR